jgi:hypothetical protein
MDRPACARDRKYVRRSRQRFGFAGREPASGPDAAWGSARTSLARHRARPGARSAVARRRWTSAEGTAKVAGYRVITRYEHFLACPVAALSASNPVELVALAAQAGAVPIAFLELPFATTEPALPAGTHLVAWRGAEAGGRPSRRPKNAAFEGAALEELPGFRADADCYLFYAPDEKAEAALPAPALVFSREKAGRIDLGAVDPGVAGADLVTIVLCVPSSRTASKGFFFEIALLAPAGSTFGAGWE